MKRIALAFILLFVATNLYAGRDNLYEMFEDYYEIKVFLRDIINESGNSDATNEGFRSAFKDVAKNRINIKFIPVDNEADADVIVNSKIREYVFTENPAPIRAVPFIMMPMVTAADIAEPKSAAKLVVDYEVRRPKDGKIIFVYKKLATDTRKPQEKMKKESGYNYALTENINKFMFRAFYKRGVKR